MEKENTNIFVISIVAIVAIVGMIILFSGQKAVVVQGTPIDTISENQGNNENLVGQAYNSRFVPKVAKARTGSSGTCAYPFTKVTGIENECWMCEDSDYDNCYCCQLEDNAYPTPNPCPDGMGFNSLWGYPDGLNTPMYRCYIEQEIGANNPPEGCPLNVENIECAENHYLDLNSSVLNWTGSGSGWGCFYNCKKTPNPYLLNQGWPCNSPSIMMGGGGGTVACVNNNNWPHKKVATIQQIR